MKSENISADKRNAVPIELLKMSIRIEKKNYRNDLLIRIAIIALLLPVMLRCFTPKETIGIIPLNLPVSFFYFILTADIVFAVTFGLLGYIRGLPLHTIECEAENGRVEEAEELIVEYNTTRRDKFDIFDIVVSFLFIFFIFAMSLISFHIDCKDCNARLSTKETVCSKCGTATGTDKDIIEYIFNLEAE